jgi:hypothetical protein
MAMMFHEPRSSSIAPIRLMKPVTVNRPIMMPSVASSSVRYVVISACVSIARRMLPNSDSSARAGSFSTNLK